MEDKTEEKIRLNMWISKDIVEQLQIIKKETGRSLLDLVRDALWRYIRWYEANRGDYGK